MKKLEPTRLEIAASILAQRLGYILHPSLTEEVTIALEAADKLIRLHEDTCAQCFVPTDETLHLNN